MKPIQSLFRAAIKAIPSVVEISYGETISIDFGMIDLGTGEFDKRDLQFFLNARTLHFEVLEYPGGNPDLWFISFNPSSVHFVKGEIKEFKTNVTLSLKAPPIAENAIQSGILRLRMNDIWAVGNLWYPPKDTPNWEGFSGMSRWLLISILGKWGQYSGTVMPTIKEYEVLVNVKPYHSIRFDADPHTNIMPGRIASIPIRLENLGNYNDTFSFRVENATNGVIISNPVSITLKPGKSKNTLLGVAVPLNVLDTGTLHQVNIQAYSIFEPNATIAERTVLIQTKGIYVSELGGAVFGFFGIIILFIVAFYLHRRNKKLSKLCKKPEKPWLIPVEKKHLEKLKLKDKKEYNDTLKMMEDEYQSSLLWYKHFRKSLLEKNHKKKNLVKSVTEPINKFIKSVIGTINKFILNFNNKRAEKNKIKQNKKEKAEKERKKREKEKEKAEKEKEKEKIKLEESKKPEKIEKKKEVKTEEIEPETPVEEEKIEPVIDRSAEIEKRRREQTLQKIKKAQEKQRRKFG